MKQALETIKWLQPNEFVSEKDIQHLKEQLMIVETYKEYYKVTRMSMRLSKDEKVKKVMERLERINKKEIFKVQVI